MTIFISFEMNFHDEWKSVCNFLILVDIYSYYSLTFLFEIFSNHQIFNFIKFIRYFNLPFF